MISKSDRRVMCLLMVVMVGCVCVIIGNNAKDIVLNRGEKQSKETHTRTDDSESHYREALGSQGTTREGESQVLDGKGLPMFDPNKIDSVSLLRYGLGNRQIHSLMSYRRHGGSFEVPLAVSKLYNWTDEDVEKVLKYMVIEKRYKYREEYEKGRKNGNSESREFGTSESRKFGNSKTRNFGNLETRKFGELVKVDLNGADTVILKRIPGVGSGIARAIVKLREKLGGFYCVEQLGDIDYISPELYEWFEVKEPKNVKKININKASFQTMNAHPYISYGQVRELMTFRRLYGEIKDEQSLMDSGVFSADEMERLSPYLEY